VDSSDALEMGGGGGGIVLLLLLLLLRLGVAVLVVCVD